MTGASGVFEASLANIGRLIVFTVGVMILAVIVEANHRLSELVDSKISDLPGMEIRYKENRQLINIILGFVILIFLLLSVRYLGMRNYLLFTLAMTCFAAITGTTLARQLGISKIGQSGSNAPFKPEQKAREYKQLKFWLDGDTSTVISSFQTDKIQRQRDLFVEEIEKHISDPNVFVATISSLEEFLDNSKDEPDDFIERLFTQELKGAHSEWLSGALEYIQAGRIQNMRDLLGRLLTLPVLIKLLEVLSTNKSTYLKWESTRIANFFVKLLRQSERSLKLLQGYGFSGGASDERIGLELSYTPEYDEFILFLSKSSFAHEQYDFSPWWLLKARLLIDISSPLSLGRDSNTHDSPLKAYKNVAAENFEEWCSCLSKCFSDQIEHESNSAVSDTLIEIKNLQTTTYDQDLILISWWAYQRLS